ncbi:MAG: hypothetical protein NTU66_08300 [Elusimicrobia bacterium]|nr:hypothetical protein [Elusimicrobiota bacterium]
MNEKVQDNATEELKSDMMKLRRDFSVLGEDVKKILEMKGVWADKLGNKVGQEASAAWADVQHKLKTARAQGEKTVDDVTVMIEDNPWTSVLTACGIGMIIGLLLQKRN